MKLLLRPIYGSAMKRKDLADWVDNKTDDVMEVLAQLYLFPNTEYENHWRGELVGAWDKVKRLKGNKLPSKEFLLQNTWERGKRNSENILYFMMDKEYQLTPREDYSLEEYIQVCEEYFNWICDYLSKEDRVYRGVIYKKLDEMGL